MKKVFVSYSWGTKEHQDWVVNLGTRLMNDSVDVVLDRWSLKDGHDIHSFMEEMVKADDIFRVLIICDRKYKEKADNREGGVGTETQIITPTIYSNQKQEKFIPIVIERDEEGKPYLPIYLSSRKYIDFSKDEYYEDSYEELLRNILEAPAIPKPKLGNIPPLYITESSVNLSETKSRLRTLENQAKKNPDKINSYALSFIESFLDKLWDFELKSVSKSVLDFGEDLTANLLSYKILRDDFISFLFIVTQTENSFDIDELISFFEKQPLYLVPKEESGRRSWGSSDFDNFKIIFHELFVYTIAVCLKNKNYILIQDLLYSRYHKKDRYSTKEEPQRFTYLYGYHENLTNYILQKYNKVSGFGYYLVTNLNNTVAKETLILADTLCYVIGELFQNGNDFRDTWFSLSFIYNESRRFEFFDKLDSVRHFEKVKGIFDVNEPKELVNLIDQYAENHKNEQRIRIGNSFSYIPFVHELIDATKIAINR